MAMGSRKLNGSACCAPCAYALLMKKSMRISEGIEGLVEGRIGVAPENSAVLWHRPLYLWAASEITRFAAAQAYSERIDMSISDRLLDSIAARILFIRY